MEVMGPVGEPDDLNTSARMRNLLEELYPLPRSITGEGLRTTLACLRRELPGLTVHEVPTGTVVFGWTVPPEWNVRSARLTAPTGEVVANFHEHNLMLLNYSEPYDGSMSLEELQPHLHSLPSLPNAIPYRTSYYNRDWGFCLPHAERARLRAGHYHVEIDTTLAPGHLSYGELLIPGHSKDEVIFSAHTCHPSLANDNLSGVTVLVELARWLAEGRRRLTYRILFAPGTIGTITFLALNPTARQRMKHGLVLAGLGDRGPITYKRTLNGDAYIDRTVAQVLAQHEGSALLPFEPTGYDERQYASPGIRIPVGRLGRSAPGTYPEYHTSLDDLDFVKDSSLLSALEVLKEIVTVLEEGSQTVVSLSPFGEPQLGRTELLSSDEDRMKVLWLLALADGQNSLLDVAERSGLQFDEVLRARNMLTGAGLLAAGADCEGP